jgi:hypothetical protein
VQDFHALQSGHWGYSCIECHMRTQVMCWHWNEC